MRRTLRDCAELLTQGQTRWGIPPSSTMPNPMLVRMLATSFLAGEPVVEKIIARSSQTLGKNWHWLRPLARRYVKALAGRTRPRHREVVRFFLHDPGFRRAWAKHLDELSIQRWMTEPQRMQPFGAASTWNVPVIESVGALADWLGLTISELEWFADLKGLAYKKNLDRKSVV